MHTHAKLGSTRAVLSYCNCPSEGQGLKPGTTTLSSVSSSSAHSRNCVEPQYSPLPSLNSQLHTLQLKLPGTRSKGSLVCLCDSQKLSPLAGAGVVPLVTYFFEQAVSGASRRDNISLLTLSTQSAAKCARSSYYYCKELVAREAWCVCATPRENLAPSREQVSNR